MKRGTIREERPDLLQYLVNEEDGELSCGSNKRILTKCSICNFQKVVMVQSLVNRSFSCGNKNCIKCKRSSDYKYKINQIINNMIVLEVVKKNNVKSYKLQCLKDNTIHTIREYDLDKGNGCPVCIGKKLSIGINDIATTHPHLIKYLKNKNDGFKYSKGSDKRITTICPVCKSEKEMKICNLVNQGFSCLLCGDGNSYPNKFMACLAKQSNINFSTEKTFDWSENKRYDIYIPSLNCIIENHGIQHYSKNGFSSYGGRTLQEEQENDYLKRELAKNNGIKYYFEIDCRKSELEWIKNSVINSELLNLLQLKENNVDWLKCHKNAIKNKIFSICELWNNKYSMREISDELDLHHDTVMDYLKKGAKLNLCNYNEREARIRGNNIKSIVRHNAKMVYINNKIFSSMSKCEKYYNINRGTICHWLNNKIPQQYINLGLRYATEEDLNTYELYS